MSAEPKGAGVASPVITEEAARGGKWITPPVGYVSPTRRFCALTGRPIARRYWQVMVETNELSFTDLATALRYATYLDPPRKDDGDDD